MEILKVGKWLAASAVGEADIEQEFQASLAASLQDADEDKDQYLGTLPYR